MHPSKSVFGQVYLCLGSNHPLQPPVTLSGSLRLQLLSVFGKGTRERSLVPSGVGVCVCAFTVTCAPTTLAVVQTISRFCSSSGRRSDFRGGVLRSVFGANEGLTAASLPRRHLIAGTRKSFPSIFLSCSNMRREGMSADEAMNRH